MSPFRIWLMAARPRTLPAAIAPVLVGTAAAYAIPYSSTHADHRDVRWLAFVAALARLDPDPDRDQPRERLLGREARRRHRGPARPGAGHLVGPHRAEARAPRDLDRVRARGADRRLPRDRRGPRDHRGRHRLDPRRRPLHRRPASLRLRGDGRALRLPLLRPRRRERLLLRPARGDRRAADRSSASRSASSRPRSWSSTTCATSRPTRGRASGRWRCAWAASARGRSTSALLVGAFVVVPIAIACCDGPALALISLASAAARDHAAQRGSHPHRRARR